MLAVPFYRVGLERLNYTEILELFVDPTKKSGNFHRISDMHVKIGMPVSFRTDDELIPVEKGTPVNEESMRHMLGCLLAAVSSLVSGVASRAPAKEALASRNLAGELTAKAAAEQCERCSGEIARTLPTLGLVTPLAQLSRQGTPRSASGSSARLSRASRWEPAFLLGLN